MCQLGAIFLGYVGFAIEPGVGIVKIDARRLSLPGQNPDRAGSRRKHDVRRRAITQSIGWAVQTAVAQQDGNPWNVQRLRDAFCNRPDERAHFDHAAHPLAQLAQNLLGIVGFAEESPVDPYAELGAQLADREDGQQPNPNHYQFLRTLLVLADQRYRSHRY